MTADQPLANSITDSKPTPKIRAKREFCLWNICIDLKRLQKPNPPKFERSENFAYGKYRLDNVKKPTPKFERSENFAYGIYRPEKIQKPTPKFERSENFAYGIYRLENIKNQPQNSSEARILLMDYIYLKRLNHPLIYRHKTKYIFHNFIFFENKKKPPKI